MRRVWRFVGQSTMSKSKDGRQPLCAFFGVPVPRARPSPTSMTRRISAAASGISTGTSPACCARSWGWLSQDPRWRLDSVAGAGGGQRAVEITERLSLLSLCIKIRRIEPGLEVGAQRGPFMVQDREPGRVAVHALDDAMLVEDPLVDEAETTGRGAGAGIGGVALPFHAPVSQMVESMCDEEEECL